MYFDRYIVLLTKKNDGKSYSQIFNRNKIPYFKILINSIFFLKINKYLIELDLINRIAENN
jgi:hypothetical protein